MPNNILRHLLAWPVASVLVLPGCSTPLETVTTATVGGAYSPNNEIEQVYYLGVFDPQEQVPPAVYRVRVHGQASAISRTRFASGWVPAEVADSLGTNIGFNRSSGELELQRADGGKDELSALLSTDRRMMMFGPEGFREAPANHRLVIAMGSNADDYFRAVDNALGEVASVLESRRENGLHRQLLAAMADINAQRQQIELLETELTPASTDPPATTNDNSE